MRRLLTVSVLAVSAVALVGCSSGDPSANPSATSPGGSEASGDPESQPTTERTPGVVPIASFTSYIRMIDTDDDVKKLTKCMKKQPDSEKCASVVAETILSSQALVYQLQQRTTPPLEADPEVADLVQTTMDAGMAIYEGTMALDEECPEAGATSEECRTRIQEFVDGPGAELLEQFRLWKPYIKGSF